MKKASITVETTFVLPIFVFFILGFYYLFSVISIQLTIQKALFYAAETSSIEAYFNEEGRNLPVSKLEFYGMYQKNALGKSCVKNDFISLAKSYENQTDVVLIADYTIQFKLPFWNLKIMPMEQRLKIRKFTGRDRREGEAEQGQGAQTVYVYIAENGTVYHRREDCTHLRLSIREIAEDRISESRNQKGGKYKPCEICIKKNKLPQNGIYFITLEGDRYHAVLNCSGLKRTVRRIPLEEVSGWPACARCGG